MFRRNSGGTERGETGVTVALGQTATVGADNEWYVDKSRRGQLERLVEEKLARRGVNQVVAANHFGHLGVRIVHHDRELIGGGAGSFPDRKVASGFVEVELGWTTETILERRREVRDSEPPRERVVPQQGRIRCMTSRAGSGVHGPFEFVFEMRALAARSMSARVQVQG